MASLHEDIPFPGIMASLAKPISCFQTSLSRSFEMKKWPHTFNSQRYKHKINGVYRRQGVTNMYANRDTN